MHRIDHVTATVDNRFTTGNPATSVKPTVVTADWANSVQEEIAHFIESRGLTLNKADSTQLKKAIVSAVTTNDDNVVISNNVEDSNLGGSFVFDIENVRSAIIECDIYRKDSTQEKSVTGLLYILGNITSGTFKIVEQLIGDIDDIGLELSIENADGIGTIKYTSTDYAGSNYEGKMTFKVKNFKR